MTSEVHSKPGSSQQRKDVFPVFLKLQDKSVLVVGGGPMAHEKLPALLEAGASVTLVAPEVCFKVETYSNLSWIQRGFQAQDLDGVWYVVAAAPPEVNRAVSEEAHRRQIFVNAVDDLRFADAYLGSIIRRGGLTFAISSNGVSPALTALIRRGLEQLLPNELSSWVQIGQALRPEWKAEQVPFSERRPRLLEAINRWHDQQQEAQP